MTTSPQSLARRLLVVLLAAAALGLASATPAVADVPVGWSEPDDVNMVHALLLLGAIPLGLFLLIALAVYVPSLARGERLTPGAPAVENQWLGGPRKGTAELAGPDGADSEAGGASGRW
ncbi:hypothetical protein [Nocardioides sp. SYSU D00038]|uniref:hypothetical protein n=1 Tax=Nocardioides sp. SYSU D00038 TaxID=2812554 RepID=UPI0019672A36|nr:hypothetical protein [Nocardioides sp. SYSU D00038]